MIRLIPITHEPQHAEILYTLLAERTPQQSISHRGMPTREEHEAFVRAHPYVAWYLIHNDDRGYVGSVYLTRHREIGLFIFKGDQGHGLGTAALRVLRDLHPGRLLANVNPANEASIRFFRAAGARHIQNTYCMDDDNVHEGCTI